MLEQINSFLMSDQFFFFFFYKAYKYIEKKNIFYNKYLIIYYHLHTFLL